MLYAFVLILGNFHHLFYSPHHMNYQPFILTGPRGISRGTLGFSEDDPNYSKHWKFTSDEEGHFTTLIASEKDADGPKPGPGIYALVVLPQNEDAGAVSPWLRFFEGGYDEDLTNEWGKTIVAGAEGLNLTLRIQRGETITGQVLDYEIPHKPLKGVEVHCEHDLHAQTHTGRGAELFDKGTITDDNGVFRFSHVYPAACSIRLRGDYKYTWLKTKLDGQWADTVDFEIHPENATNRTLGIMAATRPLFCFSGHVQDQEGHPIPDATVTLSVQLQSDPSEWRGWGFHGVQTDQQGNYKTMTETPWIQFIYAEAKGFARADLDCPDIQPGKHDLVLKKSDKKE
jgi:protocatechuate 3,4-dioxygenase beta subunit